MPADPAPARPIWPHVATAALGAWLATAAAIVAPHPPALVGSDIASGVLIVVLSGLACSPRFRWAPWALGVGVRRAGVLLVPESEALRKALVAYVGYGGKCSAEPLLPTKKSLFDAFCRGMRFNRSALFSPPEAAAALLNATRGFRYRTIYGGMRRQSPKT